MTSFSPSVSPRGSFASTSALPTHQTPRNDGARQGGSPAGLSPAPGTPRRVPFSSRRVSGRGRGKSAADEAILNSLDECVSVSAWLDQTVSRSAESNPAPDQPAVGLALPVSLPALDEDLTRLVALLLQAASEASADIDDVITETSQTLPNLNTQLRLVRDTGTNLRQQVHDVRIAAGLENANASGIEKSAGQDDEGPPLLTRRKSSQTRSNGMTTDQSQSEQNAGRASAATPADPATVLARLAALSTLRSRMTAARDVLRLAESWSTLSVDVAAYLSDAKYVLASNRLAEASSSLAVFERTPEYEGRSTLLRSLVDALETQLRPLILQAATAQDVEASMAHANVLRNVGRSEEYADLWRRARRAAVVETWTGTSSEPLKRCDQGWPSLIASVTALLEAESETIPRLFPADPRGALSALIVSCLEALEPSFSATLRDAAERAQDEAVLLVLRAYDAACGASASWASLLSEHLIPTSVSQHAAHSPTVTVTARSSSTSPRLEMKHVGRSQRSASISKSKRASRRASLLPPLDTARGSSDDADLVIASAGTHPGSAAQAQPMQASSLAGLLPVPSPWEAVLWSAFTPHQVMYADFEARHLQAAWDRSRAARQGSEMLALSHDELLKDVRFTATLAEEALSRAVRLTHGLAAPQVLSRVDQLVENAVEQTRQHQERQAQVAIEETRLKAGQALANGEESYGEGDEWRAFEAGIAQVRAAKAAAVRIDSLEDKLALGFNDVASAVIGLGTRTGEDALKRLLSSGPEGAQAGFALLAAQLDHSSSVPRSAFEAIRAHRMHIGSGRNGSAALRSAGGIDHRNSLTQPTASKLGAPSSALLPRSRSALRAYVRALQRAQCDVILAPLLPHLEGYAALPAWEATRLPGASNEYDLAMPTFSLSPTRTIGRIGESLLDLPRLLEVWADDSALGWAMSALPHILPDDEEEQADEVAETASIADTASRIVGNSSKRLSFAPDAASHQERSASRSPQTERRSLHRPTASVASIATASPLVGAPATAATQNANSHASTPTLNVEPSPEMVLQAYLRALSLSLLAHTTDVVLPSIARLTSAGAAQLAADLSYLDNILASLNVDAQSRGLRDWRDAAGLTDVEGKELIRRVPWKEVDGAGEVDMRRLATTDPFAAVARMRDWTAQ
ncbi:hypothetical protein IE81DRAFT_323782 [Ceraceosorus guamensis]|uniref:Conserved oligomeric Golgi complex subunit 7 n=1 Tax=Ceraceosorus guamensis TaxID=1522189 RepID=A0A316VXU0_9BASI|nr:hypothetical protein IE81DRAFT_323782 [Ceraceosorus guamensis]PWN42134.1 hypothetical protein IE81DRAFT_323782 [Ceraceosorus guamensis]